MISNLYKERNYKMPGQNYIISNYIREYDMSKANISVLLSANKISKDLYYTLLNTDKLQREIQIGLMIKKDNSIQDIISKGIIEAKKMLFEANNIQDNEVLSIKNDAVFVIGRPLFNTEFLSGIIKFTSKNIYSSYYKLDYYEYFGYKENNDYKLDIKGIGDKRTLHENYMLDFFKYCFELAEQGNIQNTLDSIKSFYLEYVALKLPNGYYRPLNSERYILKNLFKFFIPQELNEVREEDKKYIDISYNLNIIRTLYKYYSSIYFNGGRY